MGESGGPCSIFKPFALRGQVSHLPIGHILTSD